MTSFAMRDVIQHRKKNEKTIEFVKKFDPEKWDYYRVSSIDEDYLLVNCILTVMASDR